MIKFRSVDQLLQSEQGTAAKQRFIEVSTRLKEYEDELYANWLNTISKIVPMYLKQNLLIDVQHHPELLLNDQNPAYRLPLYAPKKDTHRVSIAHKLQASKDKSPHVQYVPDPMGTNHQIQLRYLINYNANLKEALTECSHLEKLGFHLPESLVEITLQFPKFEDLSNELHSMLEVYHLTLASLDVNEISLLHSHLEQLERIIRPATSRISFGELGTFDFVQQCKEKLAELHSILNQLRNITTNIQEHLETFRLCVLDPIVPKQENGALYPCREYFDYLEKKRKEIISSLKRRYDLIGPLLIKIEALVFGTSTGKHPDSNLV